MSSKTRSFRDLRNPIGVLILLAAFAAAAGCSTANTTGDVVVNHVDASGNSVPGWVAPTGGAHAKSATMDYIANGGSSSCTECHGSDLAGGISRVSCFNAACHHDPVANWATPAVHGATAKLAPGSSGFASCRICHGNDFSGGGAEVSCYDCHVSAPHAPKPWRASAGTTYTHTTTNPANAPVCAQCHQANPGTPGCFNNTLCHGTSGHPAGWVAVPPAPQPHGNAAKAANGFPGCQACHGADFAGTASSANASCFNNAACHGATATWPHASAPWRASAGSTYSHTTTVETGNAAVCAVCHFEGSRNNPANHPPTPAPAGTAPGCFNSTLCHGSGGVAHPVPYNADSHYTVTSATFPGSCSACHDVSTPSTKAGPVCQTCHVAASPLAAADCTSCHADPPDGGAPAGAAYPNIAGAHVVHLALNSAGTPVSCDTCHNGLGPSLLNPEHYNRAKSRVSPGDVAFLSTYNAQSGASSFNSTAFSCSDVSCHGGAARSGGNPGTPLNWRTGSLTINTACTSCHISGATQFNSYNSGEHQLHVVEKGLPCTACHNTTTLAVNHFTTLADNTISPAVAAATIGGTGTLITTWTPGAGTSGTCNAACHPGDRDW